MGEALLSASRQTAAATATPPTSRQVRSPPAAQRPRHRPGDIICSNCFVSNWKSRTTCRQCKQDLVPDNGHALSPSRASPKTNQKTSPAKTSESSKSTETEDHFMDVEDQDGNEDPRWTELSVSELKQEHNKLEALAKQLKDTHCASAADGVLARMASLKSAIQKKLPQGQRLSSLQSSLRKTQASLEKQQTLVQDLEKKLTEARARETALTVEARQFQADLEAFKTELMIGDEDKGEEAITDTDAQFEEFFQELQPSVPKELLSQGRQLVDGLRARFRASSPKSPEKHANLETPFPPTLADTQPGQPAAMASPAGEPAEDAYGAQRQGKDKRSAPYTDHHADAQPRDAQHGPSAEPSCRPLSSACISGEQWLGHCFQPGFSAVAKLSALQRG